MEKWLETLLVLLLLIDIYALGISRLAALVKLMALQGLVLALLPWTIEPVHTMHCVILSLGVLIIKVILIPAFVYRAIAKVKIKREIEPYISFTPSLFIGICILVLSFYTGQHLVLPFAVQSSLFVPTAIATLLSGLMILVSRRKAITQVLGYVLFESGIYIFSLTLSEANPVLVEMGVLLDVFVAVFIMGITLLRIKDVFDDLDVGKFVTLRD